MAKKKSIGGCIYRVVPLIFVPFMLLLWASSVLSYIFFFPMALEIAVFLYKSCLVGWICLETMAFLSN